MGMRVLLRMITTVLLVFTMAMAGCDRTPLARVDQNRVSAEEQGNLPAYVATGDLVARCLARHDRNAERAGSAKSTDLRDYYFARASSHIDVMRQGMHRTRIDHSWVQIVPDSMLLLAGARNDILRAGERIAAGEHLSNEAVMELARAYRRAELGFLGVTRERKPYNDGGVSPDFKLYMTVRGTPFVLEATRGEFYLQPSVPVGGLLKIEPSIGPLNKLNAGTPLDLLVIRDPSTRTQRTFCLNGRIPRIEVPASTIEAGPRTLIVTFR